jgi:hypothetical protein
MQLYRLFCIYFPTKDVVSGENVDQEEQVQLLVSYKECLLGRCKTETKKAEFLRSRGDRGYVGHGATWDIAVLSMFP